MTREDVERLAAQLAIPCDEAGISNGQRAAAALMLRALLDRAETAERERDATRYSVTVVLDSRTALRARLTALADQWEEEQADSPSLARGWANVYATALRKALDP